MVDSPGPHSPNLRSKLALRRSRETGFPVTYPPRKPLQGRRKYNPTYQAVRGITSGLPVTGQESEPRVRMQIDFSMSAPWEQCAAAPSLTSVGHRAVGIGD